MIMELLRLGDSSFLWGEGWEEVPDLCCSCGNPLRHFPPHLATKKGMGPNTKYPSRQCLKTVQSA